MGWAGVFAEPLIVLGLLWTGEVFFEEFKLIWFTLQSRKFYLLRDIFRLGSALLDKLFADSSFKALESTRHSIHTSYNLY